MPVISLDNLLGGARRHATERRKLSDSVVSHDGLDKMEFDNFTDDSPKFRRITQEDAPLVPGRVAEPDPIDFTTATPDEIKAWQTAAREAKKAQEEAPAYTNWDKLTRDVFYSYHTHDQPSIIEPVDPGVELHKRIMPKLMAQDEHAASRNVTRDDATMAAIATMAATNALKEALGEELAEQAREAQDYEDARGEAQQHQENLDDLRDQAQEYRDQGQGVPQGLIDQIKGSIKAKRAAQDAAQQAAAQFSPINSAGMAAIAAAAQAGADAAEAASGVPSFGSGFGQGEPSYDSPEQALTIAEMWANNPQLRAMAELFGRLDKDIRFTRAKRVTGGNDEIVDVKLGNNLSRVLPGELALLADDDFEDEFLMKFCAGELLEWSTVGEEHAGRGAIIIILDESWSMSGERNIWAKAVTMCLLHIARLEKRDFACIAFSGGNEVEQWLFPAKTGLDPEQIVEMASHFYGGGTTPIVGVAAGLKLFKEAAAFKKADLVMVGDGDAGFGPEDQRLRDLLIGMGVRLFGIGIGPERMRYLEEYCEHVVHVHDFELSDPSQATAELATHIT